MIYEKGVAIVLMVIIYNRTVFGTNSPYPQLFQISLTADFRFKVYMYPGRLTTAAAASRHTCTIEAIPNQGDEIDLFENINGDQHFAIYTDHQTLLEKAFQIRERGRSC